MISFSPNNTSTAYSNSIASPPQSSTSEASHLLEPSVSDKSSSDNLMTITAALDIHNEQMYETLEYNGNAFEIHGLVYQGIETGQVNLIEQAQILGFQIDHPGILAFAIAHDATAIVQYLLGRDFYKRLLQYRLYRDFFDCLTAQ